MKPTPRMAIFEKRIQKNDLVVWLTLSEKQQEVYHAFIDSEDVKEALNSSRCVFWPQI